MSGFAFADVIIALSIGLGLAAASGFRVFLPPMILSGAINLDLIEAGQFEYLDGWIIFAVLSAAVIVEVGGYLIPWIDNLLDIIATPAAAVAGVLMMSSMLDDFSPAMQWSMSIVAGGGVAGTVQTGTVAVRALSTGTTGGLANPVFSIFEAILAVFITIVAILAPLFALALVVIGLVYAVRFIQEKKAKSIIQKSAV
tara:strand:- start:2477 stop:3070 length:594 start_codon:yes stop_codon:yes gene_type:complete